MDSNKDLTDHLSDFGKGLAFFLLLPIISGIFWGESLGCEIGNTAVLC